ncbi:uncharacterized protein cubi_02517 [Cryptosporidium ubiquitum]|uniref:Uncharacterized protein n=1 Tax=Cryptosporidium ubiquitum TaxID=857276 RepID=A0A1J4MKA9_9CRYT|nr:uncharacterized protein cubi_02517 [Cryptosporidium ubiquitum]OII73285.1 hypothetical protein cubi_02517 [Cryptosporidium ubiquitum]
MEENVCEEAQDNVFEFKVNCLTDGHLKTISMIILIIVSIMDSCSENSYFTYFSQTLLGYIGTWLSFSLILFFYILGRSFYFKTPFKFRYVLISTLIKYMPIFFTVLLVVVPISFYLMPDFPGCLLIDYELDDNIGFFSFYKLYLGFIRVTTVRNFVRSKLLNKVLFWFAIPIIKITLFPFIISILCSSHKIKMMNHDVRTEVDELCYSESCVQNRLCYNNVELESNGMVRKESYIKELYQDLDQHNSISIRFRFFTLLFTFVLFTLAHSFIMVSNLGRAFQITYPLKLCWVYIFCLSLFGVLDILTSLMNNYKFALTFHCIIGFFLFATPCLFTYDMDNLIAKYYSFSCFFLLGIWDSSLEFITGKGAFHHFKLSTLIKYFLLSIFLYSVATGSKLLWLYDVHYDSDLTPRLKILGSLGIAISIYYLSIKKTILFKKKYQWIYKLRSKYSMDPSVFCFLNLIPSKKTFWKILKKDSFKLLSFVPITTSGITYVLSVKLLFGAFESFLTVLFVSPTLTLFIMNIPQTFSHIYTLYMKEKKQDFFFTSTNN